jgi:PAS domain S-box-containing protein
VKTALTERAQHAVAQSGPSAEQVAAVLTAMTQDLVVATDVTGLVTLFNVGAERMLGYRAEDVVGHLTPLSWHDPAEVAARALELGVTPSFEVYARLSRAESFAPRDWTLVRKDSSRLIAQLTVTTVVDTRGVVSGYVAIGHDVSDRLGVEAALRSAEYHYRTLVERVPAITYIAALDDAASTLYVSPQVETLLGFTPDEWTADAERWVKQLHPEDRERVVAEFNCQRAGGQHFQSEYRLIARDTHVVWVRDEASLVQPTAKQPGFVQGVMLDITDRKHAEAALLAAEAKYRDIVENAVEGIYQSTPDGRVLTANRALARLLGYDSPDELIARISDASRQVYVDPQDRVTLVRKLREQGTVEGFECRVRRADGRVIWILQNARAVLDERGFPRYFEGTVEDITARKEAEAEHARLEQERDQFFSSVSHDLRTPLAAITASIGVVLANEPPRTPPALHRLLVNIDEAADDMGNLVEDLLELSRLQAGRVQLCREPTDLREVALRAVREIEPLAETRRQRVQLDLPRDSVTAWIDAPRLGRVLLNLLSNATKYGREHGTVFLRLVAQPSQAHFVVLDDGPGISDCDRERIFERFYRAENEATHLATGSGLGLPIARALVDLHGGRIWVESPPGEGAAFHVALPLCVTREEADGVV